MSLLGFPPTRIKIEATKHFQGLNIHARAQHLNVYRWRQQESRARAGPSLHETGNEEAQGKVAEQ